MRPVIKIQTALFGALLAATSCRQILDIEPGHSAATDGSGGRSSSLDGGDEGGGDGAAGSSQTHGGASGAGGRSGGDGGAGGSRTNAGGGKASGGAGNPHGGQVGAGGTTDNDGGSGAGGAASAPLLPDAACAACFARNCGTEKAACEGDPDCVSGVPAWLSCAEPDSGTCTVATPGALHDFETCGSASCDFCQHLTDGKPSIEILSPSNGAAITVDSSNLVEVTVKVRNFSVQNLGTCTIDNTACGHIHINLDEPNCHATPFFNTWTAVADADGISDTSANVTFCGTPVFGRSVKLRASLSSNTSHADRIPAVQATVNVTLGQ